MNKITEKWAKLLNFWLKKSKAGPGCPCDDTLETGRHFRRKNDQDFDSSLSPCDLTPASSASRNVVSIFASRYTLFVLLGVFITTHLWINSKTSEFRTNSKSYRLQVMLLRILLIQFALGFLFVYVPVAVTCLLAYLGRSKPYASRATDRMSSYEVHSGKPQNGQARDPVCPGL